MWKWFLTLSLLSLRISRWVLACPKKYESIWITFDTLNEYQTFSIERSLSFTVVKITSSSYWTPTVPSSLCRSVNQMGQLVLSLSTVLVGSSRNLTNWNLWGFNIRLGTHMSILLRRALCPPVSVYIYTMDSGLL